MKTIRTERFCFFHLAVAAILATMILLCCGMTIFAESSLDCQYVEGTNVDENDYWRWASPIRSYIVKTDTGYMCVQGFDGGRTEVAYYDSEFKITSRRTITAGQLSLFGGFYASGGCYYVVTGQTNYDENDNVEVFRITKYDTDWNYIKSCGLKGANTYLPFEAGSCRMVMDGKYLLIRTCHTMYYSDGAHHQANVTIEVNTSNMTVTDSYTKIWNVKGGYVSHSFNQFIGIYNHKIIAVDHGDANPRSICLMKYNTDVSTGKFSTDKGVTTTDIMSFPGKSGNNTTGATVGAFELISGDYLIAGSSVVQDDSNTSRDTRNIFVASSSGGIKWLTSYEEGERSVTNPHMVRINSNRFLVLWTLERQGTVYYAFIDAKGNTQGSIYSMEGHLSDCAPIYNNGNVIWYTWENRNEDFYVIPVNDPEKPEVTHRTYSHDYEVVSAENGTANVKCSRCGAESTGYVPTSVYADWRLSSSSSYRYSNSTTQHIPFGETVDYWVINNCRGGTEENPDFSDTELIPSDASNVIIDTENEKVRFLMPGKYTITARAKYDPSVKEDYTFYVYNPLNSVSLKLYSEGSLQAGSEVIVDAVPDGGGYIEYSFVITYPTGDVKYFTQYEDVGIAITAASGGTYTVRVTAINLSKSYDASVTSDPLYFTVEPVPVPEAENDSSATSAVSTSKKQKVTVGKGTSAAAAYKAIRNSSSEEGPAGTKFGKLKVRSTKQTRTSITMKWAKVKGAKKYVIYGNRCGKSNKMKRIGVVSGAANKTSKKITKVAGKKIRKGKYYKFIIVAVDKNNKVISTSKVVHAASKGGKVGNYKSVTVKKSILKKAKNLKKGKTLKLKAKAVRASKRSVSVHRAVRYESTNKRIATVTKKGVVKARKKGTCYIYAYAQNGVYKKIKIVVK